MIERIETGVRSSKIVKHNGVAHVTGQVGEGATIQDQTRECLSRPDALLIKAGSSREKMRAQRSGWRTQVTLPG